MRRDQFRPPKGAFTRSVPVRFSHCDPAGIVIRRRKDFYGGRRVNPRILGNSVSKDRSSLGAQDCWPVLSRRHFARNKH